MFLVCLNKVVSSFEVQLIAENKSEVLPFSTDQELGSTDQKLQAQFL